MSNPSPTVQITPQQVEFYRREGYLVVDSISNPEELAQLREIYDRLFSERAGRDRGDQFDLAGTDEEGKEAKLPQILGPSNYAPEMRETVAWANAQAIASALLGEGGSLHGDHAILKPARSGAPTPWHQDEAYWDPGLDYDSFSLWMPLQDVDESMGCLSFVPRSHRMQVVPHRPIGGDIRVHGLEVDPDVPLDFSRAVSIPLKAGGATIHHNRTLHYAPGNASSEPRRAWIMAGGVEGKKRLTPHDYYWQGQRETAREARARDSRG
jgi:ectoine hydroxylase-related dioxygenase (phytanoyl-CoA dioxygenase family)